MTYGQSPEVCHLQMIQAEGLSYCMWLRSSQSFSQRAWLEVQQLQQRKKQTVFVFILSQECPEWPDFIKDLIRPTADTTNPSEVSHNCSAQ